MALIQRLISADKYSLKCPYPMAPKGICIHNTANDATASNEVAYMQSNSSSTSFHIAIDDNEAIIGIPLNRNTWHSGDGGNGEGNRNYISVEICYSKSGGDRFIKAEQRAAKEVAILLKQYNWTISNIKKHQDFSNKYCPHRTLDMGWQRFLNMIQAELNGANVNKAPSNNKEIYRVRKSWGDVTSQIGAFSNLDNAKKVCKLGYYVFNNKGEKIYPIEKDVISKQYVKLKYASSWRIYPENVALIKGNEKGYLNPRDYGDNGVLTYEILDRPRANAVTIQTRDFGRGVVYLPPGDNEWEIV